MTDIGITDSIFGIKAHFLEFQSPSLESQTQLSRITDCTFRMTEEEMVYVQNWEDFLSPECERYLKTLSS